LQEQIFFDRLTNSVFAVRGVMKKLIIIAALLLPSGLNAQQYNMFGAIAYSEQTGAHGYSYNHPSRAAAENRALKECSSRSQGCKVTIWFRNACGALARGDTGWATAWARTNILAEQQAVRTCSQYSENCSVMRWVCTNR